MERKERSGERSCFFSPRRTSIAGAEVQTWRHNVSQHRPTRAWQPRLSHTLGSDRAVASTLQLMYLEVEQKLSPLSRLSLLRIDGTRQAALFATRPPCSGCMRYDDDWRGDNDEDTRRALALCQRKPFVGARSPALFRPSPPLTALWPIVVKYVLWGQTRA